MQRIRSNRRTVWHRAWRHGLLGLALLGAGTSALGAASASPSTGGSAASPTKHGLAFYKGKTLTFVIVGNVGSFQDLEGRAVAPYIAAYLHATVNVENQTQANGIPGQDALAAANPDGLTFGILSPTTDIIAAVTNTPGVNFSLAREAWLASTKPNTSVLIASPTSPYTSFSAVVRAVPPATVLTLSPPGVSNAELRVFLAMLGVTPHYITGYSSLSALEQGYLRGDGPIAFGALPNFGPMILAGKARPIAYTDAPAPGMQYGQTLNGVPSLAQLLKRYPPKTKKLANEVPAMLGFLSSASQTFITETAVASYKVLALRAAIAYAFHQGGLRSELVNAGINPTYVAGPTAKASYLSGLAKGKSIACYMESTC